MIRKNVMCVSFEQKWNALLQRRSKDSILKLYSWQLFIINRNIAHKLQLKQSIAFRNFSHVWLHSAHWE